MIALGSQLTGKYRELALRHALEIAQSIYHERQRQEVLEALLPHLTGDMLSQALVAVQSLKDQRRQASILVALAPQLKGELTKQAMTIMESIGDRKTRIGLLTRFLAVTSDIELILYHLRVEMADYLYIDLREAKRESVLEFCAEPRWLVNQALDKNILSAITGHIVEVCGLWNWQQDLRTVIRQHNQLGNASGSTIGSVDEV